MPDLGISTDIDAILSPTTSIQKRWTNTAGAWLGIGTSPGALLLGIGIAQRYGGTIPLISIICSFVLMFALLYFQGLLGLNPPVGEGRNLTEISTRYFEPLMQKMVAALIALGMIGWFGFNVGLGGAALNALLQLPAWAGPLIIGIPNLFISIRGLKSWNSLAALTTIAVILLVGLSVARLGNGFLPITLNGTSPVDIVVDTAVFVGYISVFSVRAPDFTAGLTTRKDLTISILLLCLPVLLIALAGVSLQQGLGSSDIVAAISSSAGFPLGNLLIALSVIAPTFTTLYSGAPALRSSIGIPETSAMLVITGIGLVLAILRFDLKLIRWVVVLAAMLPPLVIPLAVESTRRRRGATPRMIPIWLWLPGALISMGLTLVHQPLAPLIGLLSAGLVTFLWYFFPTKVKTIQS